MKVLYFHPVGYTNIGDDITFHGSVEIIKNVIGEHEVNVFYTEDPRVLTNQKLKEFEDMDMFILGGTPWLWDRCELSTKYTCFEQVLELFKNKPKIALGIGSCYPLNYYPNEHIESIKNIWKDFNFISTRDLLASGYLSNLGINNYSTFCTSSFYPNYIPSRKENKLGVMFYNPADGVSKSVLDREFIDKYNNYQISIIKRYLTSVFVITDEEKDYLKSNGIDSYKIINNLDLIDKLSELSVLVSGRVHSAIPARMMGIKTYILPIDSRWLTTINFGIMPLDINIECEISVSNFDIFDYTETIKQEKDKIVSLIKKSL